MQSSGTSSKQKSEVPAEFAYWLLQHAREEEIAERKAMKRAERDIARKKEYVRRVRLQIEEKRAEVSAALMQSVSDGVASLNHHSMLSTLNTLLAMISMPSVQRFNVRSEQQAAAGFLFMSSSANLEQSCMICHHAQYLAEHLLSSIHALLMMSRPCTYIVNV